MPFHFVLQEGKSMTFGSLFAGIGGLDLGLERAGMICKWQVENDPFCLKVLEKHWPNVKRYGDIKLIDGSELERVDLICGGFPCQDVSNAGAKKGIDAARSGLYSQMLRIIRKVRSRYALMENVPGLLIPGDADEPTPISRVLGDLAEIGFYAEWECIPALIFGADHQRDRVFIFAKSDGFSGYIFKNSKENPIRYQDWSHKNFWGKEWDLRNRDAERLRMDCFRRASDIGILPVVDGIPAGMDELRSIGNAVVPQVAQWIGERIMEAAA